MPEYVARDHLNSIRSMAHEARRKVAKMSADEKAKYKEERKKHVARLAKTYYQARREEILNRRKELRDERAKAIVTVDV